MKKHYLRSTSFFLTFSLIGMLSGQSLAVDSPDLIQTMNPLSPVEDLRPRLKPLPAPDRNGSSLPEAKDPMVKTPVNQDKATEQSTSKASGAKDQKAEATHAAKTDITGCGHFTEHLAQQSSLEEYRKGTAKLLTIEPYYLTFNAIRPSQGRLSAISLREALQNIENLIEGASRARFIHAVFPGRDPDSVTEAEVNAVLGVYDELIQYFHSGFGPYHGMASAELIANPSIMSFARQGQLSEQVYEHNLDYFRTTDPIASSIKGEDIRVVDSALYYFVARLRSVIAGGDGQSQQEAMGFRRNRYYPTSHNTVLTEDDMSTVLRNAHRWTINLLTADQRTTFKLAVAAGYKQAPFALAAESEQQPGLYLEFAIAAAINDLSKVTGSERSFYRRLARLAVKFNLLREVAQESLPQ
ncbi:MAG: hypothetical protein ACR2PX_12825 [Endozoicomonas sp.]|uniref:hypothetical protein n=1 Tax=Endozoicomonas sp. TaxID=1892382 RepID=UPI003D9BD2F4